MKHKKYIIILTFIFLIVTILGFCTDTSVKKVSFRNQNFEIHQQTPSIENRDIDIAFNHKDIKSTDININNSKSDINFQHTDINSSNFVSEAETKLRNIEKNVQNTKGSGSRIVEDKYTYRSISWNEWKSNFINKFLDDSIYISSLDDYGLGTWFYYSFEVLNTGKIDKIRVFSFYLNREDKDKVRDLIQSYAYKDITKFPINSKREKAKVEAIVLLGDTETKTKPSDFNDMERIKVKNK